MKIGIDVGNVLSGGGGDDTIFSDRYLNTPEVEGAYNSVMNLSHIGYELHIISKCGPRIQEKTELWLEWRGFREFISPYNTHFVRRRELKGPMALALEIDIFIDDRQDVLDHMHWTEHKILFTSWEQTSTELERIFASTAKG